MNDAHVLGGKAAILIPALIAGVSCEGDRRGAPDAALRHDSSGTTIVENRAG